MNEAKSGEKRFTRSLTKTRGVLGSKYMELCEKEAEMSTIQSDLEQGLSLRSSRLCVEYDVLSRRSQIIQKMIRKFNENMGRLKFDSFAEDRRLTQELDALEETIKSIKERQAEVRENMKPLKRQIRAMTEIEQNEETTARLTREIAVKQAKIKDVEYQSVELIQSMIYMQKALVQRKRRMVVDVSRLAQATLRTTATMKVKQGERITALKVILAEKQRIQREKRQLLAKRKKANTEWSRLIVAKRDIDRKAEILERCAFIINKGFTMVREKEVAPSENEDINLSLLSLIQRQISNRDGEDSMNSFIDWDDTHVPVDTPGSDLNRQLLATVRENKHLKQEIMDLEADLATMDRKTRSHQRKLAFATASLSRENKQLIGLRNEIYQRESRNFTDFHMGNDALFDHIQEKKRSIERRRDSLKNRMDQLITLISCYSIEITGWHESLSNAAALSN